MSMSACRDGFLPDSTARIGPSLYHLDVDPLYLITPCKAENFAVLLFPWGLNGSSSPITVILSSDSAIPAQWLQGTIPYKEADDVFTESFLKHVFIISNAFISNSTVNLFIRDALNS
jgi:hypothetical protein